MPKISCECGNVLNISELPSPYGSKVISERDFDEIRDQLMANSSSPQALRKAIYEDVLGFRNRGIKQAYVCPQCWRLYLFASASDEQPVAVWQLEKGDGSILLSSLPT
jgi:hypothetical protein